MLTHHTLKDAEMYLYITIHTEGIRNAVCVMDKMKYN